MKKFIFLCFALILPSLALAQTVDCPFGFVNDPAPGSCVRYIDTNGNSICDLSEVPLTSDTGDISSDQTKYVNAEDLKSRTVKEIARMYGINQYEYASNLAKFLGKGVLASDLLRDLHDREGLCAGMAAEIALSIKNGNSGTAINSESETEKNILPRYLFIPLLLILLALYLLSYLLFKFNKIKQLTHARLWNLMLLITFLPAAILGLLLVIRINYGWYLNWPFNVLYWHVELASAMAIISVFHIVWHWRYFISIFKNKK